MNVKIVKAGKAGSGQCTPEELEAVNAFARTELTAEEVYTFSVILCDNEVDRENECFTDQTLEQLRDLFVGKTGICDHDWRAANQKARIYRTEVVTDPERQTVYGAPYRYLKAYAYTLRTQSNAELIAEIEGGIKKETSVGCAVARRVCSVCGKEDGSCAHVPGEQYGGKLCYILLDGAVDAYEWSFVAVPAQKNAGVTKALGGAKDLKGFVATPVGSVFAGEYAALEQQAALGREYRENLQNEVLRLCLVCDEGMYPVLSETAGSMDARQLKRLKAHYEQRSAALFPVSAQLPGRNETVKFDGEAFQI